MTQYLVELVQGRQVVYRTPVALRAAMRSGEITPTSRIFHRAASRWISITEHPEYRRFLAERRPPDWLEPIPFEPTPTDPERVAEPLGLAVLWRKVRYWLRARHARPVKPEPPAVQEAHGAPPDARRWTFY